LSGRKKKTLRKANRDGSESSTQSEMILETKLPESKTVAAPNTPQHQTEEDPLPKSSPTLEQPDLPESIKPEGSNWYWIMMALTLVSAIAVLTIGEVGTLAYIRYVSASLLLLFLPGYSLLRAIFPSNDQTLGEPNNMYSITRFSLSIVMSIAIVSLLGLILDFSPLGVTLNSLVLSLSLFTVIFSTIALFRERRGS
jgi:hypothetical protein